MLGDELTFENAEFSNLIKVKAGISG